MWNLVKNVGGGKSLPWQMWQTPRRHGGGAGGVLVELLWQHAPFLAGSQAPAGHRAAEGHPSRSDPTLCHERMGSQQYQAISHSRPRALLLYAQVLTLSVAARR